MVGSDASVAPMIESVRPPAPTDNLAVSPPFESVCDPPLLSTNTSPESVTAEVRAVVAVPAVAAVPVASQEPDLVRHHPPADTPVDRAAAAAAAAAARRKLPRGAANPPVQDAGSTTGTARARARVANAVMGGGHGARGQCCTRG